MMGHYAEETAKKCDFTREQQDAFAIASVSRAQALLPMARSSTKLPLSR